MKRRIHELMLNLHLYLGLFSTPFVLLFAVSVFFLVHAWLPRLAAPSSTTRVMPALPLPEGWRTLSGRPLIDALRPVLEKAGVHGEIGFIRNQVQERQMIVPVSVPGRETTVSLRWDSGDAAIETHDTGLAAALAILHRSPGEHAPAIRMNWFFMQAWRWLADTTAYLILFISASGVYLWYILRAERRVGLTLLAAGALSLFGMAYALSH